jgi:hypothetical protein
MKKKKLICFFLILLSIYIYFHRSSYVTQYVWKQTSGSGLFGGGIVCFGENSSYNYQWPLIKRNGETVGVVLLCFNKRLIVFSLKDKGINFYMYC